MSKSILHDYKNFDCYLCRMFGDYSIKGGMQEHHIFGGPNRHLSEKFGLKVKLCFKHHGQRGPDDVHRPDLNGYSDLLKQKGQRAFEERYSHEKFMEVFGKNYL